VIKTIAMKQDGKHLLFGSHIGKDKKGWIGSLESVIAAGGNTSQIFVSSPIAKLSESAWKDFQTNGAQIKEFCDKQKHTVFIHSAYTLNFSKNAREEHPYWIDAMVKELTLADMIGARGCVLHMGKAVKLSQEDAEQNMYDNVITLLDRMKSAGIRAKLILETSAGQGSEILATRNNDISRLAAFFKRFPASYHNHLQFCIDTCHIFAAGYDISTKQHVETFFQEWDARIGIKHIALIHFNNSIHDLGSGKDRHACIEYGKIPVEGLQAFAICAGQHGIPLVLETPEGKGEIPLLQKMLMRVSQK